MKKLALILGVLLLSSSCHELGGRLNVVDSLTVKKKHGFLNLKTSKVELKAGNYSAVLKIISDSNITLKLEGGDLGKEILVPIKAESDLDIPVNGKFAILGEKISQPFDVVGNINTDYSYSDQYHAVESCTWTTKENRCEKVCVGEPRKCDVVCKEITITHEGRKDVTYHYMYTKRDVQLELMRSGSTALAGTINATSHTSDKITDYESLCRIR